MIDRDIDDIVYKLTSKIETEIEVVLEETEKIIKNTFPTNYIKLILISLEKAIKIE